MTNKPEAVKCYALDHRDSLRELKYCVGPPVLPFTTTQFDLKGSPPNLNLNRRYRRMQRFSFR